MRSQIAQRLRTRSRENSLSAVPPPKNSGLYLPELHVCAARIIYRSPIPSKDGLPVYILNAAAFPDAYEVDYDSLLPYVLERLPGEDQLLGGQNYEVVFFAGGQSDGVTSTKRSRPSWPWFIQAYHVLSRAMRKRLQKLYIVHERSWVRILVEMFSTIVSPKFRRKIEHVSTLSQLALLIDIQDLLIPPSAYLYDRQLSPDISVPFSRGRLAFGAKNPLPKNADGKSRLPRILRETSSFLLCRDNIRTEGLFRIPPNSKLKEIVREAYDRGQKYIVWKDHRVTLPVPVYPRAEASTTIIQELDPNDAYNVYLAAGLIKTWYADLREPIFPRSSYVDLRTKFGASDAEYSQDSLRQLISPMSDCSMLPSTSRNILARHLLPLLSAVAAYEEANKMNADNLAVCFAPALLCGEDPLEDVQMTSIIRKVLCCAVQKWERGLRESCGVSQNTFLDDLKPPERLQDYEDPPELSHATPGSAAYYEAQNQSNTIKLSENDLPRESIPVFPHEEDSPPMLPPRPPRPYESDKLTGWSELKSMPSRKPAPPASVPEPPPPRYSTVVAQDAAEVEESPTSYDSEAAAVTDGFRKPGTPSPDTVGEKQPNEHETEQSLQVVVPKRKALTNELPVEAQPQMLQARSMSESHIALSGIIAEQAAGLVKRKPLSRTSLCSTSEPSPTSPPSDAEGQRRAASYAHESDDSKFAKPTWAASSRKPLTINTLARTVQPSGGSAMPQQDSSLPPPTYLPKARSPSPGLLQRMPSFESSRTSPSIKSPSELRVPGRLDLGKSSVDSLRKLYEERAGTAKELVEAGVESDRKSSRSSLTSP